MNKGLIFVLSLLTVFAMSFSPALATDWALPGWAYRTPLNITNNNDTVAIGGTNFYTVNITINHQALAMAGKSRNNGDDVRIVYNGFEIDRDNFTRFNQTNTTIFFRLQAELPAGTTSSGEYWLYYGEVNVTSPMVNRSNVYMFIEDFEEYTEGTNLNGERKWTTELGKDVFYVNKFYPDLEAKRDVLNGQYSLNVTWVGAPSSDPKAFFPMSPTRFRLITNTMVYYFNDVFNDQDVPNIALFRGTAGNTRGLNLYQGVSGGTYCIYCVFGYSASGAYETPIADSMNGTWYRGDVRFIDNKFNITGWSWNDTEGWIRLYDAVDKVPFRNTPYVNLVLEYGTALTSGTSTPVYYDDIILMDYLTPEPSLLQGAEETNITVDNPPTFSENQTSSKKANSSIRHSLRWFDDVGLNSFIFSFNNGTGWQNQSSVSFWGDVWSNYTEYSPVGIGQLVQWRVYANDTTGQWTVSDVYEYYTEGFGDPVLNLIAPTATTYLFNYTALKVTADQQDLLWKYQIDSGDNQTFAPNITLISLNNGTHNLVVWAVNTITGETGRAEVNFDILILLGNPVITITSPTINATYTTNTIPLNVYSDQIAIMLWKYQLNGVNHSFVPNTTLTLSNGAYNLVLWAINFGNETGKSSSVDFTVNYTAPVVSPITATILSIIPIILGIVLIFAILADIAKGNIDINNMVTIGIVAIVGILLIILSFSAF